LSRQMSDKKSIAAAPAACALTIDVAAGMGTEGASDGTLSDCKFAHPFGLCRYGDSLFVVDSTNETVSEVEGVLGVADPLAEGKAAAGFEARTVPLIMTAVPVLPKELARLMAQYAQLRSGVRTIAGSVGVSGNADGPALSGAQLNVPAAIALDDTDPEAGPQLIIGEYDGRRVRCLNLRTRMVTTVAGRGSQGRGAPIDGPALSQATFGAMYAIAVAPNGALFVCDFHSAAVRRISPAKRPASGGGPPAERMVTTLIGAEGPGVQFARSSALPYRSAVAGPTALTLHGSRLARAGRTGTGTGTGTGTNDGDDGRDAGRLVVGCYGDVHIFDLTMGERKRLAFPGTGNGITGLALCEDGARLFVISAGAVHLLDTRSGAVTALVLPAKDVVNAVIRTGVVTSDPASSAGLGYAVGCVIDKLTRSLLLCETSANQIVRVRGVDV
jgi:hypothetical protein